MERLTCDPKNEVWPKHKLRQVRPGKGKAPDLQVPLQTNKQLIPNEVVPPLVLANLWACTGQELPETHKCREELQGTGWSKAVSPLFPSLLGGPHHEPRMGCSIPGPQQSCHVSSGVHSPSGPCFWWPCPKNRCCENGKPTLVKNKLNKGTVERKIENMCYSIWACWVNVHYSIPKQNTRKASKGEDPTVESL